VSRYTGPNYERPFEEPDFTLKAERYVNAILHIWVQSIKDDKNAVMLYAYENHAFGSNKAASLVLDNGYLKFKLTHESGKYTAWGGDDYAFDTEDIVAEIKAYVDREFEKEVLL
jgi:hypothetical protein